MIKQQQKWFAFLRQLLAANTHTQCAWTHRIHTQATRCQFWSENETTPHMFSVTSNICGALSWSVLPATKKAFSLNGKKRRHWRQWTNRWRTLLTCYKCGKYTRRKKPDKHIGASKWPLVRRWSLTKTAHYISMSVKPLFCYFQEQNRE